MKARRGGYTVLILDTAGRSQLDDDLMQNWSAFKTRSNAMKFCSS